MLSALLIAAVLGSDPGYVMHPSVRAGGSVTGGFLISGNCSVDQTGLVCCHDNQGVRCGWPPTDAAATTMLLLGYSAGPLSTGANQTGANLSLAGGLGILTSAMTAANCAAPDTITVTIDGAASVGTEGTDFDCDTLTDAVCATNVAAWINGLTGVGACAGTACATTPGDFTGVAGTVYAWRTTGATVDLATSDATCAVLTEGTDGVVAIAKNATVGGTLVITGLTTATGGLTIDADNTKLSIGAAGATDSYLQFDATDLRVYSSGSVRLDAPLIAGTIVIDEDSGAVSIIDLLVSDTPAAGTEQSYTFRVDSTNHTKVYCEADSSGGVEDCHLLQYHAPALNPSSDQTLAGDASFDCDEGLNRIAGNGGAVILSAAPSVNDGDLDGQLCYIQGTSANTVQINDNTNVQLAGGANFVMGQGDMLVLVWDAGDSDWYEVSRSDN